MNTTCNVRTGPVRCGRPVVHIMSAGNGCSCRGCREFAGICALHLAWMESEITTEQLLLGLITTSPEQVSR